MSLVIDRYYAVLNIVTSVATAGPPLVPLYLATSTILVL